MINTTTGFLREAQKLDRKIHELTLQITTFDERLAEVEEPALRLERDLTQLRERLTQMRADARRLERAADDKRARTEKLEQRLSKVSNLREESAVSIELDLTRKAIAADEQEALQLLDQIRRSEILEDELASQTAEARATVGPGQEALIEERKTYSDEVARMTELRTDLLGRIGTVERKVYESFHQSGRSVIVALLHEDGACGYCFSLIPLQLQNQIRRSDTLIRCEACGVILTAEAEEPAG